MIGLRTGLLIGLLCLTPAHAEQTGDAEAGQQPSGKQLFENNCGACHSLELPRSQRLNRDTWRWVVDDMVNQFGATWITEEQQRLIIDYLTENYGPDRPR